MITNLLFNIANILISGIVSLLPNGAGFSPSVLSAAQSIGGYVAIFSPLVPLSTLANAVALCFSVEIAIFGWKTVKSIVSHIPQFGGSGH